MTSIPSERPTLKLGIAFVGMSVLILKGTLLDLSNHGFGWAVASAGFGIWLSWFGIFRTAGLQLLWGWGCLTMAASLLAAHFIGWLPSPVRFGKVLEDALPLFSIGWLLVVDRGVARYRTHLRNLEDNRSKLRLED